MGCRLDSTSRFTKFLLVKAWKPFLTPKCDQALLASPMMGLPVSEKAVMASVESALSEVSESAAASTHSVVGESASSKRT